MLAPDAGEAALEFGQGLREIAGRVDVLAAHARALGVVVLHVDGVFADRRRIVDHQDAEIDAVRFALRVIGRQPPPGSHRRHHAAPGGGADRADQHQAGDALAGELCDITGNEPAHGEGGDSEWALLPKDRVDAGDQGGGNLLHVGRQFDARGFAGARNIRHQQHVVAREILDVAHPMHPASGAAMQQDERIAAAPDAPDQIAVTHRGGAAGRGVVEGFDEGGTCVCLCCHDL